MNAEKIANTGNDSSEDELYLDDGADKTLQEVDIADDNIVVEMTHHFQEPPKPFVCCGWSESTTRMLFGLLLVFMLAFSWVAGTQFAKSTYNESFNAPFFTTWYTTNFMLVVFPVFYISELFKKKPQRSKKFIRDSSLIYGPQGVCVLSILKYNVSFSILWILTNYLYIRALGVISAADVTAVFSSSNAFVYILSLIWLKESFFFTRVFAVIFSIAGIVLFCIADGSGGPTEVGLTLSICSALGAAFYKVAYKKLVGNASGSQVALFLSLLGACNLILFSMVVLILHLTSYEKLGVNMPWDILNITGVLVLVFNFLMNFGIAFTFPLFISLGVVLGIPLNAVADLIFRDTSFGSMKIIATGLIVTGFMLMLIPDERLAKIEYRAWQPCLSGICGRLYQRKRTGRENIMLYPTKSGEDEPS